MLFLLFVCMLWLVTRNCPDCVFSMWMLKQPEISDFNFSWIFGLNLIFFLNLETYSQILFSSFVIPMSFTGKRFFHRRLLASFLSPRVFLLTLPPSLKLLPPTDTAAPLTVGGVLLNLRTIPLCSGIVPLSTSPFLRATPTHARLQNGLHVLRSWSCC